MARRSPPPPDCPQAIHDLPVRKLLDPAALKHVAHAADRVDETAAGTADPTLTPTRSVTAVVVTAAVAED